MDTDDLLKYLEDNIGGMSNAQFDSMLRAVFGMLRLSGSVGDAMKMVADMMTDHDEREQYKVIADEYIAAHTLQ